MIPDGYRIENDEVEWSGIDSAIVGAALMSWAGLGWMVYRAWRLVRG